MSYYYFSTAVGYNDIPQQTTLNIYTVGCNHHCEGCHSPDLQDFNKHDRQELTVEKIEKFINRSVGLIKGVCWLGGDPLFQGENIIPLLKFINEKYPNLIQVVFTGYTFEGLHNPFKQQLIESGIQYLIDGKFNGYPLGNILCNQRVYKFHNKSSYEVIEYKDIK